MKRHGGRLVAILGAGFSLLFVLSPDTTGAEGFSTPVA
jgi:hypothetical protein